MPALIRIVTRVDVYVYVYVYVRVSAPFDNAHSRFEYVVERPIVLRASHDGGDND